MKRIPLVLGACLSIGCGKKEAAPEVAPAEANRPEVVAPESDAEPAKADAAEPATPDVEPVTPDAEPAKPEAAKTDAQKAEAEAPARALVDAWLRAQNTGDFAAYEALYAGRFTGVKRAGDRTSRYDRKKWLADRKRMFSRAMKVEVANLEIAPMGGGAVVLFTQTWESGSFRDVGPKQLVLTTEGGALRVAREEMMASMLADATAEVPTLGPAQYLPVVSAPGFVGVVLAQSVDSDTIPHDAPVVLERGHSAWAKSGAGGETYELFGAAGKVCEVAATERGLFANARFHFGQVQVWEGTFNGDDDVKATDDVVARETFELALEGIHDVAKVDSDACKGALWARAKSEVAPVVFTAIDAGPFAAKARQELRKLPIWKLIQKDFAADDTVEGGGLWDEWQSAVSASAFAGPDGTTWVSFAASAGSGCGSFGDSTWALWRVQGDTWTLLSDGDKPGEAFSPTAAFDADGDGKPELTDGQTLVQPVGASWRATKRVVVPDFDCPC